MYVKNLWKIQEVATKDLSGDLKSFICYLKETFSK